jgi:DnaJ-class molecular chaperone
MNYFEGCATEAEYKLRFRTLAKKHHPDKTGGDDSIMKEINRQFDTIQASVWGGGKTNYSFGSDEFADFVRRGWGGFNQSFNWSKVYAEQDAYFRQADADRARAEEIMRKVREKEERKARFEKQLQERWVTYQATLASLERKEIIEEMGKLFRNFIRISEKGNYA